MTPATPFHSAVQGHAARCCLDVTIRPSAEARSPLVQGLLTQLKRLESCFSPGLNSVWSMPASGRASRCAVLALGCGCQVIDWKSNALDLAHSSLLVCNCLCKGGSDSCWDFPISCQYIHVSCEDNSNRRHAFDRHATSAKASLCFLHVARCDTRPSLVTHSLVV